ncbi:MAG: transposase, partial [Bacteroidia bacterium]
EVKCFSKGKEHKKYEFGSKASFLITQKTGVIVGAMNFTENIHDSKTLPDALQQHERLTGIKAKEVYVDRGYPGPKQIGDTQIHLPKPTKNITLSQRKKHRRRAAIEPTIGHLKHDYRMVKNFLKGSFGDAVNVMLAASAMNFKRMMNLWKKEKISWAQFFSLLLEQLLQPTFFKYQSRNPKLTF